MVERVETPGKDAEPRSEAAALLAGDATEKLADLARGRPRRWAWRLAAASGLLLVLAAAALAPWRPGAAGAAPAALWHPRSSADVGALQSLIMGCMPGRLPDIAPFPRDGPFFQVRVLTYNLFWWHLFGIQKGNGGSASRLIAESGPYDLMGFQECEDIALVLNTAGLYSEYATFSGDGTPTGSVCMAYNRSSWSMLTNGYEYVAADNLGKRIAQWMRLVHLATGKIVFFVNHHGPLPINTGGRCGGAATAFNLLQIVAGNSMPGDAVIMLGDFNANSDSKTIQHIGWRLHKVFWGEVGGGIDNIFSNFDPTTVAAASNLGNGGSDHDALTVRFDVGKRITRPWWWPWPLRWPMFR